MHTNMNEQPLVVWTDMRREAVVPYLFERARLLYLEPRGIKGEDAAMHLTLAASNHLELFDRLQEELKCRFSRQDWQRIEFGLQQEHEDVIAAETVVQALLAKLIRHPGAGGSREEWTRLVARLNTLTLLERHALADAGVKARAFPDRGLFNVLGSPDGEFVVDIQDDLLSPLPQS